MRGGGAMEAAPYSQILKNLRIGCGGLIDGDGYERTERCLRIMRAGDMIDITMTRFRHIEKIIKGVSNHRRIQILDLLHRAGALSVTDVAGRLRINFKTAAEHIRRLAHAGIVWKYNHGNEVRLVVSPQGKTILKFLRTLE